MLLRILTDRGSEYCGNPERHEYELYLAVENIDHSRIKTKCVLSEFNRIAFSQKGVSFNRAADRSRWVDPRITSRGHIKGAGAFGKTPMQTCLDARPMTKKKMIAA
jgi:hypothetical protein